MADNHLSEAERTQDEADALADLRKAVQAGASDDWLLGFIRGYPFARRTPVADGAAVDLPKPALPESLTNALVDYKQSSEDHAARRGINAKLILAIKDYAEQYAREAISHYLCRQNGPVIDYGSPVGKFPELPEPAHELQSVAKTDAFTAEQMFQYAQEYHHYLRKQAGEPRGMSVALAEVTDRLGREAAENLSLKMELRAAQAKLARQSKEAALQQIIDIGQEIEDSGRKQAGQVGERSKRVDWAALGYKVGATVEQDGGKSWATRAVITYVHPNGALDVVASDKKYGWSARFCTVVSQEGEQPTIKENN